MSYEAVGWAKRVTGLNDPSAKSLLIVLCDELRRGSDTVEVYSSDLCLWTDLSERSRRRAAQRLEEAGLIRRERNKGGIRSGDGRGIPAVYRIIGAPSKPGHSDRVAAVKPGHSDRPLPGHSDRPLPGHGGRQVPVAGKASARADAREEVLKFFASKIRAKSFVPPSALKQGEAERMVSLGMITPEELREAGLQ